MYKILKFLKIVTSLDLCKVGCTKENTSDNNEYKLEVFFGNKNPTNVVLILIIR